MSDRSYGVAPEGYRLPAETMLGAVRLQISNLERSLEYYVDVLGFRVIEKSAGRATLGVDDSDDTLIELRELAGARAVPRRGLLGLYHFAILLPDRASLGRFLVHLVGLGIQPGMSDHLVSEALYLGDPDGLGIEVYADRPRSEWAFLDRQLTMATNPLDTRDLIQAANSERWTGMPAGTKVGHVHLYVGDIEQAEGFYHRGLGLDKIVWSYPGALFLSAGGYHHHLGTNTWAAGAPPASDKDARLLEWTVVVPSREDAAAAARNIESRGYSVASEDGSWTAIDPWGTMLRLVGAA